MHIFRTVLFVVLVLVASAVASAQLRLPAIFGDGVVLQRNKPVTVWGWAGPDQKVEVKLAQQSATATADGDGRWTLKLEPLPTGGPYELEVTSGGQTLKRSDILSGEVWLASGQSNMDFSLVYTRNGEEEVAAANHPRIRLFEVARKAYQERQDDARGQWFPCSPESVKDFSGVAYFFGRRLQEDLDVPIGLIDASWGGTVAEAWTSREVLETIDFMKPNIEAYDQRAASFPEDHAAWEQAVAALGDSPDPAELPREPVNPKIKHSPGGIFNGMVRPLIPFSLAGIIWYQGESNVNRAEQYRTLFPALIADWRNKWGEEDLPFYFVQLANYAALVRDPKHKPYQVPTDADAPTDTPWSHLRDAQLFTLRTVPPHRHGGDHRYRRGRRRPS